jgi:hypothetical protein
MGGSRFRQRQATYAHQILHQVWCSIPLMVLSILTYSVSVSVIAPPLLTITSHSAMSIRLSFHLFCYNCPPFALFYSFPVDTVLLAVATLLGIGS